MKKILIFYPQLDRPLSGGQVIDFEFIQQIRNSNRFEVSYFLDKNLKSPSILSYNKYLLSHLRLFINYDVIFMNSRMYPRMFLFVLLLRILRFKGNLITYHHHYNFLVNKGLSRFIHKTFEVSFLKLMSKVIVPSPYTYSISKAFIKERSIKYLEIGFDTDLKINTCINPRKWLFVGTVESRKGIGFLIEVANILKKNGVDIEIHVVGSLRDTLYVEKLKMMIKEHQLDNNILLMGRLDDESLAAEYQTSRGFVFPSLHEGYGMVLIEAMSYGLPVVAFNNSAMPFTIKNHYNGIMVENKNVGKMAEAIKTIIQDDKLYCLLKDNAYQYVRGVKTQSEMRNEMKCFVAEL